MIKALIFDNFGVICNSSAELAYDELSDSDDSKKQQFWDLFRANDRGIIDKSEWASSVGELFGVTADEWVSKLHSYDGKNRPLLDYILQLKKSYRIALMTNMGANRLGDYYSSDELKSYFDEVFVSGEMGFAKPDPLAYKHVIQKMNIDTEQMVMIDDSLANIDGAESVGMKTILYTNFNRFNKELKVLLEA